jgi:heptosyltransferase-3
MDFLSRSGNAKNLQASPDRILVIAMRYLGDVLLTTALIRSLRRAYPNARLDVLVYSNTAAILEGNPDIDNVITTPNRPARSDYRRLFWKLFRRYDLAVVTQTGDRPFLYALIAAPIRIGAVPSRQATGWWKRLFMERWTEFDDFHTHTVLQHLQLAELLGIPCSFELVPPRAVTGRKETEDYEPMLAAAPYAVLHPYPQWTYKRWTVDGWVEIGRYLHSRGLTVVLSGGPSTEELEYVAAIAGRLPVGAVNLAGRLSLAELGGLLGRARLFVGPDTGITHLAAAAGISVIALYGPTNPVKWAPWPYGYRQRSNPFQRTGNQRVNNIRLIQGEAECVPCHQEGCDRHRNSRSRCLDNLSPETVKQILAEILADG